MILTAATWNLLGGGIDNGSDARLRRQLTLLAGLNLDISSLPGDASTGPATTRRCCTSPRSNSA